MPAANKSALVQRYNPLLRAVEGRAAMLGAETRLEHVPESELEPFIVSYETASSGQAGYIFIYRPELEILSSNAISFLANRIIDAEEAGSNCILLLPDTAINVVANVLRITNLHKHSEIHPYTKDNQLYEMDWQLA